MSFLDKLFGDKNETSEQRFWQWFIKNSAKLIKVENGYEPICNDLSRKLNEVYDGLVFVFGPVKDGRREFIVSADGVRSVFPAVQSLVAAAPDIPGWKIIAFRPGGQLDMEIAINNRRFGPDDIWFASQSSVDGLDLILYIRDLTSENKQDLAGAVFLLLDHALGEYNVETKIGHMDWQPLPPSPEDMGLRPFKELPEVVGI